MSEGEQDVMLNQHSENIQKLRASLNQQTAKISWKQLQRFYASGAVVAVAIEMDLINVACQFSLDNKKAVQQWLQEGAVYKVEDHHAKFWVEQQATHWAVVVAPWVLVQEISEDKS